MGFQDAVREGLANYARFSGRSSRPAFWWWVLAVLLVNAVAAVIDRVLFGGGPDAAQLVGALVSLALLLPNIAVAVRRLHDVGRSGWWLLLSLIPLIGFLVLLYWYVQPGEPGENRFGHAPAR